MILGLIDEAVEGGARQSEACEVLGLDRRTVQRWRKIGIGEDGRAGPLTRPRNSLSADERRRVIELATSSEFCDSSPKQIVPTLADRGEYFASEATMYRILRAEKLDARRTTCAPPTKRHRPTEYVATEPNQVWSWDITYLRTRVRGRFFYLYMLLDVWSRKAVGHAVHDAESGAFAADDDRGRLRRRECGSRRRRAARGQRRADEVRHAAREAPRPRDRDLVQPPERVQRQPLLGVSLPDGEVPPRVSHARVRRPRSGSTLGRRVRQLVQRRPPTRIDRIRDPRRPPRWPRRRASGRAGMLTPQRASAIPNGGAGTSEPGSGRPTVVLNQAPTLGEASPA
jgi:hypothetical protein